MVEVGNIRMSRRKLGATVVASGIAAVIGEGPSIKKDSNSSVVEDSNIEKIDSPIYGVEPPLQDALIYEEPLFPDTPFVIKPKHTTLSEENQNEGHDGWRVERPDTAGSALFTGPYSVLPGEKIDFFGANNSGSYDLNLYRLGWYGGKGGRLMYSQEGITAPSISKKVDPKTRTTMAAWGPSHALTIPDDWRSGMYMAVATGKNGSKTISPFWVRSHERTAPILTSAGLLTYNAYSNVVGLSLYGGATSVSLDRPLTTTGGVEETMPLDIAFLRFLERSGFDSDYMVDVDSQDTEDIYDRRKLIVMSGHHEYYTDRMRQRLHDATNNGINVALMGSNALYWRIRLEDSENGKNRIVVCYRNGGDPNKENPTGLFRDLGNHEAQFFGAAYDHVIDRYAVDDWVVANPDHWVFKGTGMQQGDTIKKAIGAEYDIIFDGIKAGKNREILAESLVSKGPKQGHSYSLLVERESGAKVFSTGSLDWGYTLDEFRKGWSRAYQIPVDSRAQQIATNVLKRLS
jgi:hypothetical protein